MSSDDQRGDLLISRRRLLKSAAGALAITGAPAIVHALGDPAVGSLFTLGVASGDPRAESVVIWTRLAPDPLAGGGLGKRDVRVRIEVARDLGFRHLVRVGHRIARAKDGHVVNILVRDLPSNTRFYYRFLALGQSSRIGVTRTFPDLLDRAEQVRFAVVSCQNYTDGFYAAYADIVAQEVDFVIHTGDYIYEYGPSSTPILPDRQHDGAELFSVRDYRNRYALYRLDPDLQDAHALFPFLVTWDDHEVDNNYAGLADENGSDAADFAVRRRNAYRVYRETMPLRPRAQWLRPDGELRIHRGFAFGNLADFHLLDTRQYRSDQPAGDNFGSTDGLLSPVEQATLEQVFGEVLFDASGVLDPEATLLGSRQEAWLAHRMRHSRAHWNVLAQQVMVTRWNLATTGRLSALLGSFPNPLPGAVTQALDKLATLFNVDAWDGYAVARERLFRLIDRTNPSNPVVLTGDIHSSWAANLLSDFDDPLSPIVAAEFVCTSVSSNFLTPDPRPTHELVRRGIEADNPHIEYFNGLFRGYALCEVDRLAWTTTYRTVGDIADLASADPLALVPLRDSTVQTDAVLRIHSGFRQDNGRLERVHVRAIPDLLPFLS